MKKFFVVALILFVFTVPAMMLMGGCGKNPVTPAVETGTWTQTATISATYTIS